MELINAGSSDREVGADPDSGLPVVVKAGRFGPYVQVGLAEDGGKPRTASLFSTMDPATITLADALKLLSLPRVLGVDPATGEEIIATNGRYGPYLKKGNDSRSLPNEEQLFNVGLDDALAVFAQPKERRGRAAAAAPLRELGIDPATGQPILLKEGRFGPYVTDGTTNASLRKGDTVEALTPDRAIELLADRRTAPPRVPRRASAKKVGGASKKASAAAKTAGSAAKKAARSPKKAGSAAKKTGATLNNASPTSNDAAAPVKAAAKRSASGSATKKAAPSNRTASPAAKKAGS